MSANSPVDLFLMKTKIWSYRANSSVPKYILSNKSLWTIVPAVTMHVLINAPNEIMHALSKSQENIHKISQISP